MYHFIVRQKLKRSFDQINRGEYRDIVKQFAPNHRHVMFGGHALSGTRTSLASTEQWYGRLKRLLPDLHFEIGSIVVSGGPWGTLAIATWKDSFTLPDGERGANQGVHVLRLAWGKIRALEIHCDTAKLERYCARLAELGVVEGKAQPISDLA